jgi:Tol biopolymer transport system component
MRPTAGRRSTFDHPAGSPVWAPDAKRIVFASWRDSPPNLYVTNLGDLHHDERLIRSPTLENYPSDWSPDGRFVIYVSKREGLCESWDISRVDMTTDRPVKALTSTPFAEIEPRISPDGRWLAYSSNESGKYQVWVMRFPDGGGERWLVSTDGGRQPVWRSDGRALYYRNGNKIMTTPIDAGGEFKPGRPSMLFASQALPPEDIDFTTFDVAPDGRFLVNLIVERISPPLTVVTDWKAGLTR